MEVVSYCQVLTERGALFVNNKDECKKELNQLLFFLFQETPGEGR